MSCKKTDEADILFTGNKYQNLKQYIDANADFSSFKKIVEAGKMTDALSSYNSNGGVDFTLFLPTNEAVNKFITGNVTYSSLDALLLDATYCTEIVRYHLVNGRIPSKEFPNGALANKTISNYFLTIFFREVNNAVTYSVNDESKIVTKDIILANGTIHTIDKMLTPVVYTSYQWLGKNNEFSIYSELLTKCGLADTLNAFKLDEQGRELYNEYTLFAESNELYATKNILSFNDLVKSINPLGAMDQDFKSPSNPVNKYARYHILEKSVFLDEFKTEVYTTYGDYPISVDLNDTLKFNKGAKILDKVINNKDSVFVNYLLINNDKSNVVTRSGAIHQLNHLLFPYLPGRKSVTYQFYEEPVINALRAVEGEHTILIEGLESISMVGAKSFIYFKSATTISGPLNNDYLRLSGDVSFTFKTPKILAGRYSLGFMFQRGSSNYASIQASVDGKNVGVVLDLSKDTPTFRTFTMGNVDFLDYSTHTVTLRTIIPGTIIIDRIIFEPI